MLRRTQIDVLIDNVGRGLIGAVEESAERELRDLMGPALLFFGPAALTRTVLPQMRSQRSGAVVQLTSMGGRISFARVGGHPATKFALEGLAEALAAEVSSFVMEVLIVKPGAFRTGFAGDRAQQQSPALTAGPPTRASPRSWSLSTS